MLIVNADDLGLCLSVNRGIERAHREGILTSASLMANTPGFEDGVRVARENPRLGVGVHLNLVRGRPVSPPEAVAELLGPDGLFLNPLRRPRGVVRSPAFREAARRECAAQIARVRAAGIEPTHLDAEKHHLQRLLGFGWLLRLADEEGVPAVRALREPVAWALSRLPWPGWRAVVEAALLRALWNLPSASAGAKAIHPDHFLGQTHIGVMNEKVWLALLASPLRGISEVMVHPGEVDEAELAALAPEIGVSRLAHARADELAALISPAVRAAAAGVRLGSYRDAVGEGRGGRQACAE